MICSQTMAVMLMNDPAKKVAVIICPPAEQEDFFQEQQFDDTLGGTDPLAYWRGSLPDKKFDRSILKGAQKAKSKRLKDAEKALDGHENKEEILKILRSDGRCEN